MSHSTVAILGGGPIGLETLLACREKSLNAALYERNTIGANVAQWQHVTLFSPFEINHSTRGSRRLKQEGYEVPAAEALLTGAEFLEHYMKPLAELPDIKNCIHQNTTVQQVGRERVLKGDLIGSETRKESRFRLLLSAGNNSSIATADYVIDCTGTFNNHNWLGSGGIPCPGEREFGERISYRLPDVLGVDRNTYQNKSTLVIGSGYSAATNLVALADLAAEHPKSKVYWMVRHRREQPITPIAEDRLEQRVRLTERANQLAVEDSPVTFIQGAVVNSISDSDLPQGELRVEFQSLPEATPTELIVDNIIANVGFRPDRTLNEELQVHECYATHGPMKLAATLMGETSADCLTQASHGVATLKSPEPNFYILGSKSYGRSSKFLLKVGLEQVEEVVNSIHEEVGG